MRKTDHSCTERQEDVSPLIADWTEISSICFKAEVERLVHLSIGRAIETIHVGEMVWPDGNHHSHAGSSLLG